MMVFFSWVAVAALTISYYFQIYKIHVHKEVRDLSLAYHWLTLFGFAVLAVQAHYEDSLIFLIKQIMTCIPVAILIFQIYYHRQDKWYDSEYSDCGLCKRKIEPSWKFCPNCGTRDTGIDI